MTRLIPFCAILLLTACRKEEVADTASTVRFRVDDLRCTVMPSDGNGDVLLNIPFLAESKLAEALLAADAHMNNVRGVRIATARAVVTLPEHQRFDVVDAAQLELALPNGAGTAVAQAPNIPDGTAVLNLAVMPTDIADHVHAPESMLKVTLHLGAAAAQVTEVRFALELEASVIR